MGFADDHAVDADAARQDPLFGAAPRRVGILAQQPIQQRAGLGFRHHFKFDFRLRRRDKVERVAVSLRR